MDILTKEKIRELILSPILEDEEIISLVQDELSIDLKPYQISREEWVDFIYEQYNAALLEIEQRTLVKKALDKPLKEKRSKEKKLTKKSFIIELLSEEKLTKEQIQDAVNKQFNLDVIINNTPTRVNKVLRDLRRRGLLDEESADGTLTLKKPEIQNDLNN